MNISTALQTLRQVPPGFPLLVQQGSCIYEVLAAEYSHEPARAVLKIAEAVATDPTPDAESLYAENVTLRDQNADLLLEVERLKKERLAWLTSQPLPSTSRDKERPEAYIESLGIKQERVSGPGLRGDEICNPARESSLPWANLPEPEATIAELRGELPPLPVPVEIMNEAEAAEAMETMALDPYAEPGVTSRVTVGEEGVNVASVLAAPAEEPLVDDTVGVVGTKAMSGKTFILTGPVLLGKTQAPSAVEIAGEVARDESEDIAAERKLEPVAVNPDQALGRSKRTRKPKAAHPAEPESA
jgi:hypothetical protein